MRVFGYDPTGKAPPEYGISAPVIKTIRIPLDNARALQEFEIGGSFLWVYRSSSITANLDIRLNDQNRDALTVYRGFMIRGTPFSRVYVTNTAQASEWIDLIYTRETDVSKVEMANPLDIFNEIVMLHRSRDYYYESLITQNAFIGSHAGTAAANRRVIQLWNPAASTVSLICTRVSAFHAGLYLELRRNAAALTTQEANAPMNKYLGAAVGQGEIRYQDMVAPATEINFFAEYSAQGGAGDYVSMVWSDRNAIVVPAGVGLVVVPEAVTALCGATFEWIEV